MFSTPPAVHVRLRPAAVRVLSCLNQEKNFLLFETQELLDLRPFTFSVATFSLVALAIVFVIYQIRCPDSVHRVSPAIIPQTLCTPPCDLSNPRPFRSESTVPKPSPGRAAGTPVFPSFGNYPAYSYGAILPSLILYRGRSDQRPLAVTRQLCINIKTSTCNNLRYTHNN